MQEGNPHHSVALRVLGGLFLNDSVVTAYKGLSSVPSITVGHLSGAYSSTEGFKCKHSLFLSLLILFIFYY